MPRLRAGLSRLIPALCALVLALCATLSGALPVAAASAAFTIDSTVQAGDVSHDVVIDAKRGRSWVVVDRGRNAKGAVTWVDSTTGKASGDLIELDAAAPSTLVLSRDGAHLYVLHYGVRAMSVVNLKDNTVARTLTDEALPLNPTGMTEDTDTGLLYAFQSSSLVRIDPAKGEVSRPISVSEEAYPLIKDVAYDSANKMMWVAEGRASIITAFSTTTSQWMKQVAIPVGKLNIDGQPLGGRPNVLAFDAKTHALHIDVRPTTSDKWKNDKILTLDTEQRVYLGEPIEVGVNVNDIVVNEATREVYTTDAFDNTVSVISPDTWKASVAVDFNKAGLTDGVGAGGADTSGIAISDDGTTIQVTHPYTGRVSTIKRSGATPEFTLREPSAEQSQDDGDDTNSPWEGPAAPSPAATPSGAQDVASGDLTWSINEYMKAWAPRALGETVKDRYDYTFKNATGWWDVKTGKADLVWKDGLSIQHYPGLAPEVATTLGNPRLQVDESGKGTLTMDLAWTLPNDVASEGYTRVTVATFSNAQITQSPAPQSARKGEQASGTQATQIKLTATPDFEGRPYTRNGVTHPNSYPADFIDALDDELKPWWMTTGASMDSKKVPNPFTVIATLQAAAEPETPATSEPATDGSGTDGSDSETGSSPAPAGSTSPSANPTNTTPGAQAQDTSQEKSNGGSSDQDGSNEHGGQSQNASDTPNPSGTLPRTGATVAAATAFGLLLVGAGLVLTVGFGRRRGRH